MLVSFLLSALAVGVPMSGGSAPPPICDVLLTMINHQFDGCTDCKAGEPCRLRDMAWDPVHRVAVLPEMTITSPPGYAVSTFMHSTPAEGRRDTNHRSVALDGAAECQVDVVDLGEPQTLEQAAESLKRISKPGPLSAERYDTVDGDAVMDWLYFKQSDRSYKVKRYTIHANLLIQKVCSAYQPLDFGFADWTGIAVHYSAPPPG